MNKTVKCLLIGFYDRNNIGDDTYKVVIPYLLPSCDISAVSCDDVVSIEESIDIVLIGGGDLVNDYFMNKVQLLLKSYKGRVYGVSLGIPFISCCHYLHIFDHVFVRSQYDFQLASKEIGNKNVTYLPDFSVALSECGTPPVNTKAPRTTTDIINVGVCLAQPLFFNNPKKTALQDDLCRALKTFSDNTSNHVRFILIPFNSNEKNNQESDYIINNQVAKQLKKFELDVVLSNHLRTPTDMLDFFQTQLDICLCMRFHSVMFSLICNIPFVPLYVSQKVQNVLDDVEYLGDLACKLPHDIKFRPTQIDAEKVSSSLLQVWNAFKERQERPFKQLKCKDIVHRTRTQFNDVVVVKQPYATLISRVNTGAFVDVLNRCNMAFCKYLNIEPSSFQHVLHNVGELRHDVKSPVDIARFLCYNMTGEMHHPCVWGLAENLQKPNFNLYEALKYIYDETETSYKKRGVSYYPTITNFTRKTLIHVDFIFSNDFTKYHRSGWSYVVGGLMNLDATIMLKQSDVFVDTYVDRSFHWGKDIMKTLGEIPYTKTWYGFIHHTFDTTHSVNNCNTLFEQDDFMVSLQTCKGLITLSQYLKTKVETALQEKGVSDVPVYVLYHPMQFVDDNFTMQKFIANANRKVVQIGAWLRNPYAMYQMILPVARDFEITKAHLKGTEMDLYFAPPHFIDILSDALYEHEGVYWTPSSSISRGECAQNPNSQYPSNKYSQGALDLLKYNHNSVLVLDKLPNAEYDMLLAENIVFLNLVDCSAVNTVIECIVRNTPLIVNRHPAIEEILGKDYPGFYSTLQEASALCVSLSSIEHMHQHMKMIDKSRYQLENFMMDFQEIIVEGKCSQTYNIKQPIISQNSMLPARYKSFYRFLPQRYWTMHIR